MNRKHFSVYFKLWEKVNRKQNYCVSARGSSFGIAVDSDEYSVLYQSVAVRMYILDCYMRNKAPQKHVIYMELSNYKKNKQKLESNKKTHRQETVV